MSHEVRADIDGEHLGEAGSSRGRLIAIATVLTTLAAATTGFLQASAVRQHDEAAVRAERLAALAVNVAAGNLDQAQVQIDRQRTWMDERIRAAVAAQAARRGDPTARLEAGRWMRVAAATAYDTRAIARHQDIKFACDPGTAICQTQGLQPFCPKRTDAPECNQPPNDSDIARYRETAKRESYRLSAEREAANQEADAAESRFSHLAAALVMLAVAVFLFGYSLTPQGRARRGLFTFVATGFLVAGLAWSASHSLGGYDRPPRSAAIAFANGEVALRSGDLPTAIAALGRAVDLAPQSVDAYVELAEAEFAQSDRKSDGTGSSVDDLRQIVKDDQAALDNGSESPTARFDLAASLLVLGIKTGHDEDIRRARDLAAESLTRFEQQVEDKRYPGRYLVFAQFTVAEADLALGAPATRRHYCEAVRRMVTLPAAGDIQIPAVRQLAHADVSMIHHYRPGTNDEGRAILRQVDRAAHTRIAPDCAPQTPATDASRPIASGP